MTVVQALNGSLLVLVGLLPWNGLAPVQMRSHGFAVFVLGNQSLITSVSGIGQTHTDDRVAYPLHKLAVLGVGHLLLIHPE